MNELSAEHIKAIDLDRRIKTSAQLAQQSLYDMCMGFKEMRDSKLYKELGYSDFGEYCEKETGFTKMNVYRYISIAKNLPQDFVTSMLRIGTTKLVLLSTLSEEERAQVTENTDLENTSVRELEEQVKQLKRRADEAESRRDDAQQRVIQLEGEIKDLESRPIDLPPAEPSKEVADLKDAMRRVDLDWSEKYAELQEANFRDRRELLQKAEQAEKEKQDKLAQLRAEYEKKLAEKPAAELVQDDKAVFKAYLSAAADSVTRLVNFVNEHNASENYGLFTQKARQLAEIINSKLEV